MRGVLLLHLQQSIDFGLMLIILAMVVVVFPEPLAVLEVTAAFLLSGPVAILSTTDRFAGGGGLGFDIGGCGWREVKKVCEVGDCC